MVNLNKIIIIITSVTLRYRAFVYAFFKYA